MTTEQKLQWVAVPGGVLPGRPAQGHRPDVTPAAHRRRRHPGGLPRPARLARRRVGRDLAGRCRRHRPAGPRSSARRRSPTLWAALFPPQTPVKPWEFPDLADRPDGDLRRDGGARPAQGPVRQGGRRVAGRAAVAAHPTPRRTAGAGSRRPARPRWSSPAPAATASWNVASASAAPPPTCSRAPASRPRPAGPPVPAAAPRSTRCRRGRSSRSSGRALFHSSPETEPRRDAGRRGALPGHASTSTRWSAAWATTPSCCAASGLVVDLAVPADALPAPTGFVTATPVLAAPADAVVRESVAHRTRLPRRRAAGSSPLAQTPDPTVPEGLVPLSSAGVRRQPGRRRRRRPQDDRHRHDGHHPASVRRRPGPAPARRRRPHRRCAPPASHWCRPAGPTCCRPSSAAAAPSTALIEGGPAELFAEDLVRGYRLDVHDDQTGAWRSLHERVLTATGRAVRPGLAPVPGEGQVQVSLAERLTPPGQAPDPNGELYVHEALVSWDGWSLSAPRAGLPLSPASRRAGPRPPRDAARRRAERPADRDGAQLLRHGRARDRCPGCGSAGPTGCGCARSTWSAAALTLARGRRPRRRRPRRGSRTCASSP